MLDVLASDDDNSIHLSDQYTQLALEAALADILAFCYTDDYGNARRNASIDFTTRVLSHLLTHDLAHRFEIGGLVELTSHYFKKAFLWYCANSTSEDVRSALQQCSSSQFVEESGLTSHALDLLRDTVLGAFTNQIGAYKTSGRFKEALELMEAVPLATAYLYSRPLVREKDEESDDETDGDDEKDGDEREGESHIKKRVKAFYETL